jgi:chromosome segregation ATPase
LLHLTAAEALNKEYQAKLHEDDTQLHRLSGLLNHWERKCDSQAKEIQRLAEREQTAAAALEQCTARSALLYQHIEEMQLQEGDVNNVRKPVQTLDVFPEMHCFTSTPTQNETFFPCSTGAN